jgi:hypothetical protein
MVNVEELDPDPFISLLNTMGLETVVNEKPLPFDIPGRALPGRGARTLRI